MTWTQFPTFTAGEALLPKRRVKIESGTATTPPEVVYADAGEQHIGITGNDSTADGSAVSINPINATGTYEGTAADSFAIGATLYGAVDGKISDTSSGSAIGIALEAATADGDVIEFMSFAVLSTTAATVSYADAGGQTAAATVEAALAELYTDLLSAQSFINIPVSTILETDGTNVVGYLGPATTPVLDMLNGDTDSALSITWAAADVTAIAMQVALPPNLDVASDLVLHFRGKMGGATDTPTIASDTYFNEGDTKVEDASAAMGAAYAENVITIAAADIPAGAQSVTVELTPGAHGTDTLILTAFWLEHTAVLLTS